MAADGLDQALLAAHGLDAHGVEATRTPHGLIQTSFVVRRGGAPVAIAQRVHPVFDPGQGLGEGLLGDIDAVTSHLDARGLPTPRLLRRRDGGLGWRDADGHLWRLFTFLPGETIERVDTPARAHTAAALVARFHAALADLEHTFAFRRPGAHDTAAHLARLAALGAGARGEAARLADDILAAAARRPALPATPARLAHGDLKISNVLFTAPDRAHALVDLDTMGPLTLAYELGDALRSWCNPLGEDTVTPHFDREVFDATLAGYQAVTALAADERDSLLPGAATVALELASRFATDVIEDRYFGWDPTRFASRRAHNLVRARGQLALHHLMAGTG
jgi:Ser/Thr protein kinase RdoA (MazF antagonist)